MILTLFAFCFALQLALVVAFVLGFFFTEKIKPLINVKPFNCRPCLTFWLSMLCGVIMVCIFHWHLHIAYTPIRLCTVSVLVILASFINFLTAKLNTTVTP